MTNLEFIEAFTALLDSGITLLTVYISIVSGYLVAAYFAGSKLNGSQVFIVTGFFVVTAVIVSYGQFALFRAAHELERGESGVRDLLFWSDYITLTLQLFGVVVATKFMFDTRKH